MIGAKAEILLVKIPEAFDHQARTSEQGKCERELRHDQSVAQPQTLSGLAGARALLEGVMQRDVGGAERGRETKEQAGGDGNRCRKEQDSQIDVQSGRTHLLGDQAAKHTPTELANEQAECAPHQG